MPDTAARGQRQKQLRADARRNRQRVLVAAREAFTAEGPSVSLDDIARRAGVGAGTVHRHFPTKDALFTAVVVERLDDLTADARELVGAGDPEQAFFGFFDRLAGHARQNLALHAALSNPTGVGPAARAAGASLVAALAALLDRAQDAGVVRTDIGTADLQAIISGALTMERGLPPGSAGRGFGIVTDGLRR